MGIQQILEGNTIAGNRVEEVEWYKEKASMTAV